MSSAYRLQKLYDRLARYERFWESAELASLVTGATGTVTAFVSDGPMAKIGGAVTFGSVLALGISTYLDERCKQRRIEISKCLSRKHKDIPLEAIINEHPGIAQDDQSNPTRGSNVDLSTGNRSLDT